MHTKLAHKYKDKNILDKIFEVFETCVLKSFHFAVSVKKMIYCV